MFTSFKKSLKEWYFTTNRLLPWKKTKDPYKIWLSEIILQQTRVEQGRPYYEKFIKKYPNICKLANAPIDDVLKDWEGLGYYSRARNLYSTAQEICFKKEGKFPDRYEDILALKGIGKYTAAAIASFAYNLPHAVVDGNVYRVLSRWSGSTLPIDTTQGQKYFSDLAQNLLDIEDPGTHNQALMDLGATVCLPQNPLCHQCPFQSECKALEKELIKELPVKSKKLIRKERFFHFLILTDKNRLIIQQRTDKDIWKHLYQFPLIELETLKDAVSLDDFFEKREVSVKELQNSTSKIYKQILTHRDIIANFTVIIVEDILKINSLPEEWKVIEKVSFNDYAYPKIIRQYWEESCNLLD
jgi:A/G-specific adenine glycosylase